MNAPQLFVDMNQLAQALGISKARKTKSIAQSILISVAKRLRLCDNEILTGSIEDWGVNGYWVLHIQLCSIIPNKKSRSRFCLRMKYTFAAIFITVYSRTNWRLGVGECGASVRSITRNIYRGFRKAKRSIYDSDYM